MQPSRATLPRVLGPWAATAIVIGTVIGSGVFLKPKAIAADVPYPGLAALVWLLGGLLALAGALVYAEVCVLLPRAGGNYVFLREAYGRLAGWLYGWVDFWMIRSGSIAALATAFALSAHDVWTSAALRDALGWPTGRPGARLGATPAGDPAHRRPGRRQHPRRALGWRLAGGDHRGEGRQHRRRGRGAAGLPRRRRAGAERRQAVAGTARAALAGTLRLRDAGGDGNGAAERAVALPRLDERRARWRARWRSRNATCRWP